MPEQTDVDVERHFDIEAADEAGADTDFAHYALDGETDVRVGESLDCPVQVRGVEYVIGYRVDTPLTLEEKFKRAQLDDDIDLTDIEGEDELDEAVEDRVTFGEVYHSNADGDRGELLLRVEDEDSVDDIVNNFTNNE
jgi:hypothetical protein